MGSGLLTPGHLVILAIIALLVFGPKRLPELGRSLGSGLRGFKHAIEGDEEEEAPTPVAESSGAPTAASSGAPTAASSGAPTAASSGAPTATVGVKKDADAGTQS